MQKLSGKKTGTRRNSGKPEKGTEEAILQRRIFQVKKTEAQDSFLSRAFLFFTENHIQGKKEKMC